MKYLDIDIKEIPESVLTFLNESDTNITQDYIRTLLNVIDDLDFWYRDQCSIVDHMYRRRFTRLSNMILTEKLTISDYHVECELLDSEHRELCDHITKQYCESTDKIRKNIQHKLSSNRK